MFKHYWLLVVAEVDGDALAVAVAEGAQEELFKAILISPKVKHIP